MSIRLGRKARAFALQCSNGANTNAELTGPTATDVPPEEPTANWSVVADTDLLQHVIERIFSAGVLLNSPRNRAASSAARIEAAIAELDEALLVIADAAFELARSERTVSKVL